MEGNKFANTGDYDSDIEFEINDDITDTEDILEDLDDVSENGDGETSDNEDEEDTENEDERVVFRSKNGYEWNSLPPPSSRRRMHNIVTENFGLINGSANVNTMKEMFGLFVTPDMVKEICHETNIQLNRLPENKTEPISEIELYSFIGIMLASGRNRSRKQSLHELWSTDCLFSQPFFTAAMSRDRFISIYSHIRFDDRETRQERFNISLDKLEPIRSIFEKFVVGCQKNYSPTTNITVDERLAAFRGNCPFRVYMKSKPGKYGIKIWIAADSFTAYITNLQTYTGMVNNRSEINQGNRVVMDLVQPQYGTNRGITTDNFFTSVLLSDNLLEKNLTLTGTLRKNKREIPKKFLPSRQRELHSSIFGFTSTTTLVSYVPQINKAVLLLSTQFHDGKICEHHEKKPEIILHYNKTKGAVDTGDKMTAEYSCVRSTRRWPFRIFMEILDMAALNSYILWTLKYPEWKKNDKSRRKCFIRELSLDLVKPNIIKRKNSAFKFHKPQQDAIDMAMSHYEKISPEMIVITTSNSQDGTASTASRASVRNCRFCPYATKKKSTLVCNICKKPVCTTHRKKIMSCPDCERMNEN